MTPEVFAMLFAAVLGGGTVTSVVNAIVQRRKVAAETEKIGGDLTASVVAAAREMVDPLRKELALERSDHAGEIALEQAKVVRLRVEMDAALHEAQVLRGELAMARVEADELRRDRERYREMVRDRDRRIAALERDASL